MKILSIDTASDICTVAILDNETCIKEIVVNDARNHSEKIMPVIQQAFEKTNINLKDINLIVCDKGPGSFTGIRIGIGTILAFQDTLDIPCIGISSLEALAYNIIPHSVNQSQNANINSDNLICSLIDAKNNNVYLGIFKYDKYIQQIDNFEFKTIDETVRLLKNYSQNNKITFVGDGSVIYRDLLKKSFENCLFSDKNNLSSYSLGLAGLNAYKKGIKTSLIPLYLRKSQAERALDEKNLENKSK